MNSSTDKNTFPLQKLLDIISKQHDAFKYQTGSFIDIVHYSDTSSEPLQKIKKKLDEIYILTHKVQKLLDSSRYDAEEFFKNREKIYIKNDEEKVTEQNDEKINQKRQIEEKIIENFKKMQNQFSNSGNSSSTKITPKNKIPENNKNKEKPITTSSQLIPKEISQKQIEEVVQPQTIANKDQNPN